MKRFIALLTTLLLAGCYGTEQPTKRQASSVNLPDNPQWVNISTSEEGAEFDIDSSSIRRSGSNVEYLLRTKLAHPDKDGDSIYASQETRNCDTQAFQAKSFTTVSSKGEITSSQAYEEKAEIQKPKAGTVSHTVYEFVCSKQQPVYRAEQGPSYSNDEQLPLASNDEQFQQELLLQQRQHQYELELQAQRLRAEQSNAMMRHYMDDQRSYRESTSQLFKDNDIRCRTNVSPNLGMGQQIETNCY